MKISFKEFVKKGKMVLVTGILLSVIIGALVNKLMPTESLNNFLIFYIVIPIGVSLLWILVYYLLKIRKEKPGKEN